MADYSGQGPADDQRSERSGTSGGTGGMSETSSQRSDAKMLEKRHRCAVGKSRAYACHVDTARGQSSGSKNIQKTGLMMVKRT